MDSDHNRTCSLFKPYCLVTRELSTAFRISAEVSMSAVTIDRSASAASFRYIAASVSRRSCTDAKQLTLIAECKGYNPLASCENGDSPALRRYATPIGHFPAATKWRGVNLCADVSLNLMRRSRYNLRAFTSLSRTICIIRGYGQSVTDS